MTCRARTPIIAAFLDAELVGFARARSNRDRETKEYIISHHGCVRDAR